MANERVLIVDDDPSLRELTAVHLRRDGFTPVEARDGESALALLLGDGAANGSTETDYDLVVLDLMLGGIDGFEVLRTLRRLRPELPVIILSARSEDHDKVLGFGLGADDYVTKPFSPVELMARVRARLRKNRRASEGEAPPFIDSGPFRLDLAGCVLYKRGVPLDLSAREFILMRLFIENPLRVFTKAQIYARVGSGDYFEDNTVMVLISRLRDKIEDDTASPRRILTVRGLGYKYTPADEKTGSPADEAR